MYIARASSLPPLLCLSVRPLQLLVKRQQVLVMRLREQPFVEIAKQSDGVAPTAT